MYICRYLDLISEKDILNWTSKGTPEFSPASSHRIISTQSLSYEQREEDTDNGVKRTINISIILNYTLEEFQNLERLGSYVVAKIYTPTSFSFVGTQDYMCNLSLDTDRKTIKISLKMTSPVL